MKSAEQEKLFLRSPAFSPRDSGDDLSRSDTLEPEADSLEFSKEKHPARVSHGDSARMESMAISLWSWLIVGILSAGFLIWLIKALSHLGSRVP